MLDDGLLLVLVKIIGFMPYFCVICIDIGIDSKNYFIIILIFILKNNDINTM